MPSMQSNARSLLHLGLPAHDLMRRLREGRQKVLGSKRLTAQEPHLKSKTCAIVKTANALCRPAVFVQGVNWNATA